MNKARVEVCAVCGQGTARELETDLSKVLLGHTVRYARREFVCATCHDSYTDDEQGEANERAERLAIRRGLEVIGPKEIRIARKFANATQSQMEAALGFGRNTLARWETGQRPIPEYVKATFRLIALNPLAADLLRDVGGASKLARTRTAAAEGAEIIALDFPSAYKSNRFEPTPRTTRGPLEGTLEGAMAS
jgi:DNA-binding transcriptional regulator YiaG